MKKLLYILLFTPVALFGQSIISIEQDVPLELQSGWNMFGYSCYEPIDVAIAFTSIVDKIVIVKGNSGNVYMPEFGFNGIGGLHINRGYQIKLTEAITDFQFCSILVPLVEGCVDETAFNYNSSANMDDGSCEYIGCMDDNAENYDSIATINNDACIYSGCMDAEADNYNPNATLPAYPPNFCEYLGCLDVSAFNFDPTANLDDSSCEYPIDTLFYYDCHNILFIENESDAEIFDLMINDFDEGITPIFEGEGADVLDAFSSFFLTYNSTPMYNTYNTSPPTAPNGDLTFDWDENTDPTIPDTAWYISAFSWFTNTSVQADNWLGMGPITIPNQGADFKFFYRSGPTQWIDGFDLYITTDGMEPYSDIIPGETNITYSIQGHYPIASPQDTIWTQHSVSLNNFAGQSVYLTFHHNDTDKEMLMLDNFLVVTTNISGCIDYAACNFNPQANFADGSCTYAQDGYDCSGNTLPTIYQVGDLVEGGIVFYVDETGQHGLVAALEDIGQFQWGCYGTSISGADGQAIGTGLQNTLEIVSGCSETPIAASEALAYESGGYSDWFLPSKDELVEMYNTIGNGGLEGNIGSFENTWYWSSSESNNYIAWYVNFLSGSSDGDATKFSPGRVRVIRAF